MILAISCKIIYICQKRGESSREQKKKRKRERERGSRERGEEKGKEEESGEEEEEEEEKGKKMAAMDGGNMKEAWFIIGRVSPLSPISNSYPSS